MDVHGEVRFIKVWASLSHIYSGDIELSLQSPAGTVIKLSNSRESYGTAPTESESINVAVTVCDSHTCNSPVMLVGNSVQQISFGHYILISFRSMLSLNPNTHV